jgi:hypothetical protein
MTEPRKTERRKTEPRMTKPRMTEPRMTEPRIGPNLEWPELESDRTSNDQTSKRTELRVGPNLEWPNLEWDWTSNEIEPRKWSNKFNLINLMSIGSSIMKKIKNPPEISQNQPTIWTFYLCSSLFKGTGSWDWDVLLVVWMDRALLGDEPLTGFITICCFLVFNFVFYYKRFTSYLGSVELCHL